MSNGNDNLEIWVKISQQIGELTSSINACLDKISNHEQRIVSLEKERTGSIKTSIVEWLVKGIVASIFVIGTLTGAGGLLKGIFGL